MTPFQLKALKLIKKHPGITASRFAELMWPKSDMHKKSSNQGNGACTGKAAWLAAGSHIGKLRKMYLVEYATDNSGFFRGYKLTPKGEQLLASVLAEGKQNNAKSF